MSEEKRKWTQKRRTFPISFRVKSEVMQKLEDLAKKYYPSKKPNKTRVLTEIVLNCNFDDFKKLEAENADLKKQLAIIKKAIS